MQKPMVKRLLFIFFPKRHSILKNDIQFLPFSLFRSPTEMCNTIQREGKLYGRKWKRSSLYLSSRS